MSNVLGTIIPVNEIIKQAHASGVPVLVDGAQSVPHMPVDVQEMACEFMAFSAHKMLGPTGVGILYVKKEILEKMQPFLGGGDMIKEVHKYETIYNDLPYKFEGGTPNIADVIGFSAALDYLTGLGMDHVSCPTELVRRCSLPSLSIAFSKSEVLSLVVFSVSATR